MNAKNLSKLYQPLSIYNNILANSASLLYDILHHYISEIFSIIFRFLITNNVFTRIYDICLEI